MSKPTSDNLTKGIFFALATSLVGSSSGAAGKLIAHEVNTYSIVLVQYAICVLIMLPLLWQKGRLSLKSTKWRVHFFRGMAGWIGFITFFAALSSISLVEVNLLRNTAPLFVPLILWLWLRDKIAIKQWIPLITGFIGVALILKPSPGSISIDTGYLLGLASGFSLAISMVATRELSKTESSMQIMFYYFIISMVCSIPLGIYFWEPIPLAAWPYLIYIGVSIYLALWLYTLAYSYAPPAVVSPISYFSVVFSGLLGWVFWNEAPSILSTIGIVFVVIAGATTVYLSNTYKINKNEP